MKKSIYLTIFALLISFNAAADEQISASKKTLIDTLLGQTGQASADVGTQFSNLFIQQMTMMLKKAKPDMDPRGFDIVEEEVNALIHEEMIVNGAFEEMMYPIYAKHFTESELEQMIEINKTEIGQKILKVTPALTQESMQMGQQFGQSLAPKIQERIQARFEAEGIK